MRRGAVRCGLLVAWFLIAAAAPGVAAAGDLAYAGRSGALTEQAVATSLSRPPGFDRGVALATTGAVADAVRSGQATGGMIPARDAGGIPAETATLLLGALDPKVRVVGETRIETAAGGTAAFWVIVHSLGRTLELHPDRLVVNVEAPDGSKAFSLVVAGLSKLGFTVTAVASVPLSAKPFGFRYMLALAADRPILALRATDAIARDSRVGDGHALLIGAWRQGS